MKTITIVIACLLAPLCVRADVLLDDFEDVGDWSGLELDSAVFVEGSAAGLWDDQVNQSSVSKDFPTPLDGSGEDTLSVWIHSEVANGAFVELVFDSENDASDGWDYYIHRLVLNWTGWKHFWIPLDRFSAARQPIGWHQLNRVQLSASGWNHEALPDSVLRLDDLRFTTALVDEVQVSYGYEASGDYLYTYSVSLSEKSGGSLSLDFNVALPPGSAWQASLSSSQLELGPNQAAQVTLSLRLPAVEILPGNWLVTDMANFVVQVAGLERDSLELSATVPLPERASPRLLLDGAGLTQVLARAGSSAWAEAVVASILSRADNWPADHNTKYGLSSWELPPEGGQWTLWYVCPIHGVRLEYQGPGQNICPVDGQNHTGWPFDQVIYAWRHGDSARAARDLGLAYRLSGDVAYAQEASQILMAYADVYSGYALHDVNGGQGNSGARASAQTLDESGWLIPLAWAYDLVADSPALTDPQRMHIEQDLLRAAVNVIQRNDAGMSNWQSWHNAAVAAVGFGLQDANLAASAVHGQSGFLYQMDTSVTADGLWYEGSWGYHFFALDPLMQTALMAELAGLELFGQDSLHSMFNCAVNFAMPDLSLPPFNDSGQTDLTGRRGLYEVAYARYLEEELSVPLVGASRGREALFWGVDDLPLTSDQALGSLLFPDAGFAVLRAGQGSQTHYLALDHGPHGGWHGHFDKLGFVSFAQGQIMGLDPGTQSYAAPTHDTWDKLSVAHNTLVVDETTQAEATGTLLRAVLLPHLGFARAEAGPVYPDVARLVRTMALTPEYALDVFQVQSLDGQGHQLDLAYHNPGQASSDLSLSPYAQFPNSEGYQHLSNNRSASADLGFSVTFDTEDGGDPEYGRVWTSDSGIGASFSQSRDQANSGSGSGKLHYDFSAAEGYILYTTDTPPAVVEVPSQVRLAVYGDGSGHELRLRVMDATDERFVTSVGPIDWTGWQMVSAQDLPSWSHYLGNDDGLVDTPVKSIVIDLNHQSGGPSVGDVYVDDIYLFYSVAGESLVADFDRPYRALTWQMAPEPGTTLVVGEGLGPDLQVPVPFAMARRQATNTSYLSILEPHGLQRRVNSFEPLDVQAAQVDQAFAFRVEATAWKDFILLVGDGPSGTQRQAAGHSCDGLLCYARLAADDRPITLAVGEGSIFSSERGVLIDSTLPFTKLRADREADMLRLSGDPYGATVRILAPQVAEVLLNDGPVDWTSEGEYVILNPGSAPDGGPDGGSDGGPDAGDDGGIDAGADGESDGETDGESDGGSDGGSDQDGGDEGGAVDGGCGCAGSGSGKGALWVMLLLATAWPRRRKW